MFILRLIFLKIIILLIFTTTGYSLRCRTEDGPSDGELKRVARSCMRKFGDVAFAQNSQQQQQIHYNQQQQQHQQSQGKYGQRVADRDKYGYNYQDSDEADNDEFDGDQYYNNYNNNNNRNYQRQQNGDGYNNYRSGGHSDDRQRNRSRYNDNNQNRTTNENGNNNWNYSNQRNIMSILNNNKGKSNNNNNNNMNNNNNGYNQNNTFSDVACIVNCFFAEMHMLNNQDYPDRHKMLFILTKDLRDRELRNFYTDTIQECFRYLENQRRRDKCQFSRDLITCMTEYAKGNCDDWNEFNMMFN